MTTYAAAAVCLLLAGLSLFQVILALGAPLGRFAWGGQHRVLPTRLRAAGAVSIAVYAVLATIVLARADVVNTRLSDEVVRVGAWVVAVYFLVAIGGNLMSRSKPERAVMAPLAAVMCGLCVLVAAS